MGEQNVVLVHGLWVTGHEMGLLGRRLAFCGFVPRRFPYPDVRAGIAENAQRLRDFLSDQFPGPVSLVAHSLGGIVVLRALHDFPDLPVRRAVLLGTPVRGSIVARRLLTFRPAKVLFGKSLEQGLDGDVCVPADLDRIGVIAGTLPVGLGQLVGGCGGANDGVVAVAETELPDPADRLQVRTNHIGLVISREVAGQVCHFLEKGRFSAGPGRGGPL